MKLYLVISLALWQTSNGKYVNDEYEPDEIQDQVFEASGDYTSNYGVASDDEDLYNEDGSGDGLYVSREEEDLLEDLKEIENDYDDVEFDDDDELEDEFVDDYEENYEEITQLDNEEEVAPPEDEEEDMISETLKDYEETVINLNKKIDATMKRLDEDEIQVEEAIEEFFEEETKLIELEKEEVAAMEDLEERIEAELEDGSDNDEYEIEYVDPEESEEDIIIDEPPEDSSIVETVIENVEEIAEEVTEEIIDDTSSISKADYNEYDDSISDKSEDYNPEPRIVGLDMDQGSATIQNAVIAGVIAAMLICIIGILFVVHRIKKKDEGSYKISASPSQKQSLLNEEAYA